MPLYEFKCQHCKVKFELITREGAEDYGHCPKCGKTGAERLISRFKIGGQGDLRESTVHGCHGGCSHNHHHGEGGFANNDPADD